MKQRTINFRAKDVDGVKWLHGDLRLLKTDVCIFEQGGHKGVQVKPETVGQFTGLKDKNGKEIYEGDILTNERRDILHVVAYSEEEARFVGIIPSLKEKSGKPFTTGLNQPWLMSKEKTIIGNIHDNPELLKEG
jgi:uncharacterized phage protein (TIGR01671 family)